MTEKEKEILLKQKITRAKSAIHEIKVLISFGYYETSVNRIYYACFYCVQALLAKIDLFPKTHKGVIIAFNLHYVKEGRFSKNLARFYQEVFEQRLMADYTDTFEGTNDVTVTYLANSILFIEETENLLGLNK